MTDGLARAARVLAAFGLAAPIAACSGDPTPAEVYEIANIHPANIIPNSTPRAFVNMFDTQCVNGGGNSDSVARALLAIDYVELRETGGGQFRHFVVDTRNPLVSLSQPGAPFACIVTAESRTGQTNAVGRYILSDFPDATPLPTQNLGRSVEEAWQVRPHGGPIIMTLRNGPPSDPARYSLVYIDAG